MTYAGSAPPVPSEKFAYAQKLAAALGYAALQRYDLVQVTAFAPSRGRRAPRLAHRADSPALLTYLEGLRPGGNTGFAKALRNLLARSHRGTYLILLSDFRDDHWLQGIRALLHGTARIALVHIQDRSDFSEPSVEAIDLVDPETGAARSMDGRPEPHRSREQPDTHLRRHLVELARHHGFDYVPVSLDTRFDEMLLRSLGLTENRGGS